MVGGISTVPVLVLLGASSYSAARPLIMAELAIGAGEAGFVFAARQSGYVVARWSSSPSPAGSTPGACWPLGFGQAGLVTLLGVGCLAALPQGQAAAAARATAAR